MTIFTMTAYQPPSLDAPISVIWDLWSFNIVMQNGLIQYGVMEFRCYPSKASIGMKPPLDTRICNVSAAQVSDFQRANNLQPGAIAAMAYGLAQSIQDVIITPAVDAVLDDQGNVITPAAPAVRVSFFQNATIGQ